MIGRYHAGGKNLITNLHRVFRWDKPSLLAPGKDWLYLTNRSAAVARILPLSTFPRLTLHEKPPKTNLLCRDKLGILYTHRRSLLAAETARNSDSIHPKSVASSPIPTTPTLTFFSNTPRMVAEVLISMGFIQCRLQIVSCDCNITTSAYIVVIGAPKKMLRIEALLLFCNLSPPTCNVSWLSVANYLPS